MKVILLHDVAKIGRRFDIVSVSDGYALNKLIPQKFAQEATPGNIKRIEAQSEKNTAEKENADAIFAESVSILKETKVTVATEANEDGKLFQALKADRIVEAANTQTGAKINASQIVLKNPIKKVGEHTIHLISGDAEGEFILEVSSK